MAPPKVIFLMADYGNDPTETATPYTAFRSASFSITFATENGTIPHCDARMYIGWTGKLLGAPAAAVEQHTQMMKEDPINHPVSWKSTDFDLKSYDLAFLPGGHDKGMQQIITSESLHKHLAGYVPMTKRGVSPPKAIGAICHGVQVLAAADAEDGTGKSAIHDFETTSLTTFMESTAYWTTRAFLGDYYKTFGAGTDNVETLVRKRLDNPEAQYKSSMALSPFTHSDPKYNYISGR